MSYLEHPIIKDKTVQSRIYQQILFSAGVENNTLIILPTGLGKTVIMIMLIAKFHLQYPDKQIIVTAPTRPLVDQHYKSFTEKLNVADGHIGIISGNTKPSDRIDLWKQLKIIIATPQTLRNDIISKAVKLENVALFCVDEAHRAVKDDTVVLCTKQFRKKSDGRIVGFTASPGNRDTLSEVVKNLSISNIEIMDESDPSVSQYVQNVKEKQIKIDLNDDFKNILDMISTYHKKQLEILKEIGIIKSIQVKSMNKKTILGLPTILMGKRGKDIEEGEFFAGMKAYGQLMLVSHAQELLETQGLISLMGYFSNKEEENRIKPRKSLRSFLYNPTIKRVKQKTEELIAQGETHPKLNYLIGIVESQINQFPDSRILIFANYKSTVNFLVEQLKKRNGPVEILANRFVGQSGSGKSKGLSQKEQKIIMQKFHEGVFNVLVSTSVGEEGLDVAQCDLVIFYESIPSTTRLIQRRGRTGRQREGKVIYLITKGTRDEGFYYLSKRREQKLHSEVIQFKKELEEVNRKEKLEQLKKQNSEWWDEDDDRSISKPSGHELLSKQNKEAISPDASELDLTKFDNNDEITIFIDHREKGSAIINALLNEDINVIPQSLPIGDYIISEDVAIERKTVLDFANTLQNRDLFAQLNHLQENYLKPILIIEGENIYQSSAHPNAIRGALAAITLNMGVKILFTKNPEETASLIAIMAKREQLEKNTRPQIKKNLPKDMRRLQLGLISSLPNVNYTLAKRLLHHFKNPREIFKAHPDELRKVQGIGMTIANHIDVVLSDISEEKEE